MNPATIQCCVCGKVVIKDDAYPYESLPDHRGNVQKKFVCEDCVPKGD